MAETPHTPHKAGGMTGFLQQSTAGLPNWAWILVVGAGIAAAVVIPRLIGGRTALSSSTDTAGTTPAAGDSTGLGLAVDPVTGLPYAVEGLVPSGGNVGTPISSVTSPTTGGTAATSPPIESRPTYQTRQSVASGWGSGVTSIPIRQTPGGSVIGSVGFGQRIIITGSPISGPNNFGASTPEGVGSTLWYPTSGGYVSAWDVMTQGTGSTGPTWPTTFIRSRHMHIGVL